MFKTLMQIGVVILCGSGLLALIPVMAAIVMDFVKGMKEIFRK